MKNKFFNKYILCFAVCLLFIGTKTIYANHTHDENCYTGIIHYHTDECYGKDNDYRECGGALNWVKTDATSKVCEHCGATIYIYDIYTANCASCGNSYTHYTEREIEMTQDGLHRCSGYPNGEDLSFKRPETPNGYPNRTKTTDTSKIDFSGKGPICGKEENHYYEGDKEILPLCDKIAVSVVANTPQQTSDTPDLQVVVTFLDGHTEVLAPTSTTYVEGEAYNATDIQLIYFGKISATDSNTLIANTKLTNTAGINKANGVETPTPTPEETKKEEQKYEEVSIFVKYPINQTVVIMIVLLVLFIIGKIYTIKTK